MKPREVDWAVVERVLSYRTCDANREERLEIVREWIRRGRALKALTDLTGWNVDRYARQIRETERREVA